MGTHSTIAIERIDGTRTAIYCHYDGYVEYNGVLLQQYYNTAEKVEELLKLGDLSVLGARIIPNEENSFDKNENNEDCCRPYTLRGEPFHQSDNKEEFNYVFDEDEGVWFVEYEESRKPHFDDDYLTGYLCFYNWKYYSYTTKPLIEAILESEYVTWDTFREQGVTIESLVENAREARLKACERQEEIYNDYYHVYCD